MEEEFNLNDKGNLNPTVGERFSKEEKREVINNWNNNPVVKENKIKAIDTSTNWLKNAAILTLIIISITSSVFAYLAWKDGTLLSTDSTSSPITCGDCGNVTLNTTCPACPACNLSCGNITLQPILNITINSS